MDINGSPESLGDEILNVEENLLMVCLCEKSCKNAIHITDLVKELEGKWNAVIHFIDPQDKLIKPWRPK